MLNIHPTPGHVLVSVPPIGERPRAAVGQPQSLVQATVIAVGGRLTPGAVLAPDMVVLVDDVSLGYIPGSQATRALVSEEDVLGVVLDDEPIRGRIA